jgi:hypothetical protein
MTVRVRKDLNKVGISEFCKHYKYTDNYYNLNTNLNISFGMYMAAGTKIEVVPCKEDTNWYLQKQGNVYIYWHKNWLEISTQLEFDF